MEGWDDVENHHHRSRNSLPSGKYIVPEVKLVGKKEPGCLVCLRRPWLLHGDVAAVVKGKTLCFSEAWNLKTGLFGAWSFSSDSVVEVQPAQHPPLSQANFTSTPSRVRKLQSRRASEYLEITVRIWVSGRSWRLVLYSLCQQTFSFMPRHFKCASSADSEKNACVRGP